jgi:hypothetical protein
MKMLSDAHGEIVLQTPYLVLTRRAGGIFKALQKKQPPVQVIVSTNSLASTDALGVYALSYKHHKKYLVDYGFEIHELMPHPADAAEMLGDYYRLSGIGSEQSSAHRGGRAPIEPGSPGPRISLHAKSLVVDGRIAMVGSHNFDPRSAHYNTEGGVIVDDPAFARAIAGDDPARRGAAQRLAGRAAASHPDHRRRQPGHRRCVTRVADFRHLAVGLCHRLPVAAGLRTRPRHRPGFPEMLGSGG